MIHYTVQATFSFFSPNPERFKVLKEAYERGLRNFRMEQPHQHAVYYNNLLLSERAWEKDELLEALKVRESNGNANARRGQCDFYRT